MSTISVDELSVDCSFRNADSDTPDGPEWDACGLHASSAIHDAVSGTYKYRCPKHKGLLRPGVRVTILSRVPLRLQEESRT